MAGYGAIINPAVSTAGIYGADPRMDRQAFDRQRMEKAAQDFEAQFVFQLLEVMAPEIDEESPWTGGFSETMFRPQLHEAIAEQVVKQGGFGLADAVLKELVAAQERGHNTTGQ